jgi:hypothetical protein
MATAYLTQRDIDLLTAVERSPLTVHQLRALSVTFSAAFGSERRLQDRLTILTRAGLLRRFRYAATEGVGRYYYVLTAERNTIAPTFCKPTPVRRCGTLRTP